MVFKNKIALFFFISFCSATYGLPYEANSDTAKNSWDKPKRVYITTRLTTDKPVIDGKLNDACWKTGNWSGNFTQWIPKEGAEPSMPTEIKILYDDRNLYIAIRAFDNEPEKIVRKAGRRDEITGDVVGVNFDSYHDHRTGFEFDITAAGQKIDLVLTNPMNGESNWNAVWYAKTGMEDSAWTAEFEIPLSQLRYSSDNVQVWGMHCWRWIDRLQEESDWEPQSSTGPGMLYLFGELRGIEGLPEYHRIEIMPYSLGKLSTFKNEPGNPFKDKGHAQFGNIGLDANVGLSSNFTANLTINPDFGQVESDPSVMNLTAFETFYEEKRPFFLEGKNIFNFDFEDANIFYSRRIGQAPGYSPDLKDGEYLDYPDNTTIISAEKVSGKTSGGLSVGVLQSLTANQQATIYSSGKESDIGVEPLTNYLIARVQQDYSEGNTVLGGILTSTNRFIKNNYLNFMNRNAFTGGVDFLHQWNDKEFYVDAKFIGSYINGSKEAMNLLQSSSARYYQRPDAGYLKFDSSRSYLSGYGGSIKIGKGSAGFWRYSTNINWRSPGLDLNDLGYMQTADIINQVNSISYFVNQPVSIFRTYSIELEQNNNWDFGLDYLSSGAEINIYLEFLNKWAVSTSVNYTSQTLDTRLLRGGNAMFVPSYWANSFYIRTDPSEKIFFDLSTNVSKSGYQSASSYQVQPGISFMPLNILKISLSAFYSTNLNQLQYINTEQVNDNNVFLLGKINQRTIGATFRIDYNITTELSIQYYGSPFASVGKYSEFKTVTNSRAANYNDRFLMLNPVLNGNSYEVLENNPVSSKQIVYTFNNPDFNFFQFRSNLVLRWEYLPGSQIYLVWSQDRTNYITPGNNSVYKAISDLKNVYPNNIFLIKINYWFSI